jgi:hypothetical protein
MKGIAKLLWPGNSPDLNMIEPCWACLKRVTTRKGGLKSRGKAEKAWIAAWKDLQQKQIQQWIKRIMRHIKEVVRLDGGNECCEGIRARLPTPDTRKGCGKPGTNTAKDMAEKPKRTYLSASDL